MKIDDNYEIFDSKFSEKIKNPSRKTPVLALSGLSKNVWNRPTWKRWLDTKLNNDWQSDLDFCTIDNILLTHFIFLASRLEVPTKNTK